MQEPVNRQSTGFSLIELVIVMAIISIITTLSVNGYRRYVLRANRADATGALLRIAAAQERYYLHHDAYAISLEQLGSPEISDRGLYLLSLETRDPATRFRAHARPAQGKPQQNDRLCRVLTIDQVGRRSAEGADVPGTPSAPRRCWR